jgi:hypothetical protein
MQTIKRVALSSPESSYPDGKSRYVVSQMFTQFGGHSGEVKLYDYNREVRMYSLCLIRPSSDDLLDFRQV